jgi:hypothetical protein
MAGDPIRDYLSAKGERDTLVREIQAMVQSLGAAHQQLRQG